ncbi:MAG TPA: amidohydrolase family protein, partial [Xanthobacteraceae bacterium]|nr:amidohydrolase family protein [Xanthobacteraceae bacterium]
MNMELKAPLRAQKHKLDIVDCDIHPKIALDQLRPHLSNRWWDYLQTYGARQRHAYVKGYPFPKATPQAARRDAWPPTGGLPASDLDFLRKQHLDHYGIGHGIMNPLSPTGQGDQNVEFSAAMARAANEAQVEHWVGREPRLRASVCVPYEDGEAARAEIRRCAGRGEFAQVFLLSRTSEA